MKYLAIALATVALAAGIYYLYSQKRLVPPVSNEEIAPPTKPKNMTLTSPAFEHNQPIPSKYTCDGENVSPPLKIGDAPPQAKGLAMIMDDPDAPSKTWVHWLVWNINPQLAEIAEGAAPVGASEGITDFGSAGYGGPCPHSGIHRYFFKLYALDTAIDLPAAAKPQLEEAMKDHTITQATLIGLYQRRR